MQAGYFIFYFVFPVFLEGCCMENHHRRNRGISFRHLGSWKTRFKSLDICFHFIVSHFGQLIKMNQRFDSKMQNSSPVARFSTEYYTWALQSCGGWDLCDAMPTMGQQTRGGDAGQDGKRQRGKWASVLCLREQVSSQGEIFWSLHMPQLVND